ncbi:MAG: matrixin family metalloprotease [Planctomycetes bacterium]|nr:matrixin family metalloprotease [Planctomycetota bacterium]
MPAIFVAALAAFRAHAVTILPLSAAEMVRESSTIVEGRVVGIRSGFDGRGRPMQFVRVLVGASHKGAAAAGNTVEVAVPGGRAGQVHYVVPGAPRFAAGEEVVLFLRGPKSGKMAVLGFSQGYYSVVAAGGRRLARRKQPAGTVSGGPAAVHGPGTAAAGTAIAMPDAVELAELRRFLRDEVHNPGKAKSPDPAGGTVLHAGGADGGTGPPAGVSLPDGMNAAAAGLFHGALLLLVAAAVAAAAGLRAHKPRAAAVAAVLGLAAAGACGYVREVISGHEVYWASYDVPVEWLMEPDATSDCLDELAAVQSAFDTWEEVPTATIAFTYGGAPPYENDGNDGLNIVYWDGDNSSGYMSPGTLGVCAYWANAVNGRLLDADIIFNDQDYAWRALGEGGTQDLEGVATHEIGHLLGLGHPPDHPEATMWYQYHPGSEVLAQDDIDGVSAVYPDTVAPAPPVITTNGGADFTTADAALVLAGTMAADTWELRVNGSTEGVAAFAFGDTAWSYSTTLEAPGENHFSVTALDASGNTSAPDSITVTFSPAEPVVDTFVLYDLTTASAAITDWPLVGVDLAAHDYHTSVAYYLLTESASFVPDAAAMAADGGPEPPRVYMTAATQGQRDVYAWVMDTEDNIGGPYSASIILDSIPPFVTGAYSHTADSIVVEFSEDVNGAGQTGAYSVAPATGVGSVAVCTGRKYILKTQPMSPGASYTLTVSGVSITDRTGENTVYPGAQDIVFTAGADGDVTVQSIRQRSHTETLVAYTAPVLGAAVPDNYRVGADTFASTASFAPDGVEWLGGRTFLLSHFDAFLAVLFSGYTWPDDFPFETCLAVRNVVDESMEAVERNYPVGAEAYYLGSLYIDEPVPADGNPPVIDSFVLRALDTRLAGQTVSRMVAVEMQAHDGETGIVRWHLTENPAPPAPAEVLAAGSWLPHDFFILDPGAGGHTVYAYVLDADGNMGASSAAITLLPNGAPSASAAASPVTAAIPPDAEIAFTSAGTSDPEGAMAGVLWYFGDGGVADEPDPLHTYSAAGEYKVMFLARDAWGAVDSTEIDISIIDDAFPPQVAVGAFTLRGRVDTPSVAAVNIDGTDFPVTGGMFSARLTVPSGGTVYTITVDDGVRPPHVATLEVASP